MNRFDDAAPVWRTFFFAQVERVVKSADALVLSPGEPPPYGVSWTLTALGAQFELDAFEFDLGVHVFGAAGEPG
jgi:hypothetical protein